jgi:hypothetical protein
MKKIGRNDGCPCRSGKKYKHCCALKPRVAMRPMTPEQMVKVTLKDAVDLAGSAAMEGIPSFRELGVFLLFSTPAGDAWLLEITESDCVQLARNGQRIDVPIDETPETIVVDWTHTFAMHGRKFAVTSYEEKLVTILPDAPAGAIHGAIRRIRKKHSPELLDRVHLDTKEASQPL